MKRLNIVSFIVMSIPSFSLAMEFNELKNMLEEDFPPQHRTKSDEQKIIIYGDVSCEDFLDATRRNDIDFVRRCLRNVKFKEHLDFETLLTAHEITKQDSTSPLRFGISHALKTLFPRRMLLKDSQIIEEQTKFSIAIDNNQIDVIDHFLTNKEFLDKTPIYLLEKAQAKTRAYKTTYDKIKSIITQKRLSKR